MPLFDEPEAEIASAAGLTRGVAPPRQWPVDDNIWPPSPATVWGPPAGARWARVPLKTPVTPSQWPLPAPPTIATAPPGGSGTRPPRRGPNLQQRPPSGPALPAVMPNARMPITNALVWNASLPDNASLPPASAPVDLANGRNPVSGAKVRFTPGTVIPPGWEL